MMPSRKEPILTNDARALFQAQLACVGVMALACAGCFAALIYSSEMIFWLCLGGAVIGYSAIFFLYRHNLKKKRNDRRKRSKQIAAHCEQVF
jgi:uncharacterized membrane protein YdjX (TVP38/TMEM64 family)